MSAAALNRSSLSHTLRRLSRGVRDELAVIYDLDGRLIWRSGRWLEDASFGSLVGYGWLEFTSTADSFDTLAWIIAGDDGSSHSFCTMIPQTGSYVRLRLAKVRFGEWWAVMGDRSACLSLSPGTPGPCECRPEPNTHQEVPHR